MPPVKSASSEAVVLPHPALKRRTALRDRRPLALRRHTGRVATRFAVLVAGDVVAILLARAIAMWLYAETLFGLEAFGPTPLVTGGRRFLLLALLTIVAVFTTGGHSRHRALNQPIRLFSAAEFYFPIA